MLHKKRAGGRGSRFDCIAPVFESGKRRLPRPTSMVDEYSAVCFPLWGRYLGFWRVADAPFRRSLCPLRLLRIVNDAAEGLLPRFADWKAASWLLEKKWPPEFGDRRPLPPVATETEPGSPMTPISFVLSMPNGEKRETIFEEAEKIFCNFPRQDTYQPPTEEGKSSPAPEPDGELLDANVDDLRSNG